MAGKLVLVAENLAETVHQGQRPLLLSIASLHGVLWLHHSMVAGFQEEMSQRNQLHRSCMAFPNQAWDVVQHHFYQTPWMNRSLSLTQIQGVGI